MQYVTKNVPNLKNTMYFHLIEHYFLNKYHQIQYEIEYFLYEK